MSLVTVRVTPSRVESDDTTVCARPEAAVEPHSSVTPRVPWLLESTLVVDPGLGPPSASVLLVPATSSLHTNGGPGSGTDDCCTESVPLTEVVDSRGVVTVTYRYHISA